MKKKILLYFFLPQGVMVGIGQKDSYVDHEAQSKRGASTRHHEDQDHRAPREEVLCMDRRLHPRLAVKHPADVDLQAGVRRVRPLHRAQEVLLSWRKMGGS